MKNKWIIFTLVAGLVVSVGFNIQSYYQDKHRQEQLLLAYTEEINRAGAALKDGLKAKGDGKEQYYLASWEASKIAESYARFLPYSETKLKNDDLKLIYSAVPFEMASLFLKAYYSEDRNSSFQKVSNVYDIYTKHINKDKIETIKNADEFYDLYQKIHNEMIEKNILKDDEEIYIKRML